MGAGGVGESDSFCPNKTSSDAQTPGRISLPLPESRDPMWDAFRRRRRVPRQDDA